MIEVRPATADDLAAFGSAPQTVRAWAVYLDGRLAGLGGYTVEHGRLYAFSETAEGVSAPKLTVWRAAKELMRRMAGLPLVTIAHPDLPNSGPFLRRLGFEYAGEQEGKTVYTHREVP